MSHTEALRLVVFSQLRINSFQVGSPSPGLAQLGVCVCVREREEADEK